MLATVNEENAARRNGCHATASLLLCDGRGTYAQGLDRLVAAMSGKHVPTFLSRTADITKRETERPFQRGLFCRRFRIYAGQTQDSRHSSTIFHNNGRHVVMMNFRPGENEPLTKSSLP